MTRRIDVIDISHWQENVDFEEAARSGTLMGVIHKATEGTSYVDPDYVPRFKQALDTGLCWGAYHFLLHGNIVKQMEWFLAQAALPPGSRAVIDYEEEKCTLADLEESLDVLSSLDPTLEIAVYCGGLLKGQVSPHASYPWLSPYPLWLAQYTSGNPSWPTNIWDTWSLWQYTDSGKVPGISGGVDCNLFNGTPENCVAWMGPTEPEPVEPARHKVVEVSIRAPAGVSVRVNINDEEMTTWP